ncbi:MAG: PPC domain-containing protein [Spirochaetales bacterium]
MRTFSRRASLLLFLSVTLFSPLPGQSSSPSVEPSPQTVFRPIELGERINGRIGQVEMSGSELVDWYELRIRAGADTEIVLRSDEIDTYLVVILPDGTVLENDDAVGTDSIVLATSDVSGTAVVGVTSFGFSSTGSYSLEVSEVDMSVVSVGRTTFDELGSSGRARYRFRPPTNAIVAIEIRSSDFDTYLEVERADGLYYYNDDAGDTNRSRVIVPFEDSAHEVIITVSSYAPVEPGAGSFELSIEELDVDPLLYSDGYLLSDGEQIRAIALPPAGVSENIASRFRFQATQGERIEIELRSGDFDSYLEVIAPGGMSYDDDDSAGYPDSRLTFIAPETGTYETFAGALNRSTAGVFTLVLRRLGTAEIIVESRGELSSRDETDITGKHYDLYRFTAGRGETVTLEVQSDDFDAYIILRNSDGEILSRDDDGGSGLNSKIEYQIESTGSYELVVTSLSIGSVGSYSVQIYK